MAIDRLRKAIIDTDEKMASHLYAIGCAAQSATASFENLRLAIPTDDVREIRQTAIDVVDRAMR